MSAGLAAAQDFDILIDDGRIENGTGNPAFHGDVGIKDGRIIFGVCDKPFAIRVRLSLALSDPPRNLRQPVS